MEVPRIPFESVAALAAAATPTLLEGLPWPNAAAFSWAPTTLSQRLTPALSPVRILHGPRRLFWNPEDKLSYNARFCQNASREGFDWHGAQSSSLAIDAEAFFAPDSDRIHFFTTNLLDGQGQPHPDIGRFDALAEIASGDEPPMLKAWMGTAGAVTPLHLDASHNFYAQLHGEKTFLLYPPSAAHEALYMHPRLHPLCHIDEEQLPRAATPAEAVDRGALYPPLDAGAGPQGRLVRLRAGDVMYLPPYWGHHAHCERSCIAANLWLPSQPGAATDAIGALPIPFEGDWDAPLRRAAVLLFLRELLTALVASPPMPSPPTQPAQLDAAGAASGLVALLLESRWRRGEMLGDADGTPCEPPAALAALRGKFGSYAATRASHLRAVDEPVRSILVHDQLELIAHWADGVASCTHALLRSLLECVRADEREAAAGATIKAEL